MAKRSKLSSALLGLSFLLIRSAGACGSSLSQASVLGDLNICRQGLSWGEANISQSNLKSCSLTEQDYGSTDSTQYSILNDEEELDDEIPYSLYEVKPIPGKGLGLIALRHINPGTKILIEKPLLTVAMPEVVAGQGYRIADMVTDLEQEFEKLSREQQEEFLNQHDHRFPGEEKQSKLLTILRSNAYNTGDSHVGAFPKMARINHSCKPNCGNFWSEKANHRIIYAESHIEKGQEITVTYIPLLKSIKERQARIHQYGFVCDCSACQSLESSKRRVKIADLLESLEQKLYSPSKRDATNEKLVKKAVTLIGLLEDEGLTNYFARVFHLAAVFNERLGNSNAAIEWAVKELEIHQWAELDSKEALTTMHYIESLGGENR